MANNYMKRCSISDVVKEMQNKKTGYLSPLSENTDTSSDEDVEQQ
jgi:predicted CopG family antitoxin